MEIIKTTQEEASSVAQLSSAKKKMPTVEELRSIKSEYVLGYEIVLSHNADIVLAVSDILTNELQISYSLQNGILRQVNNEDVDGFSSTVTQFKGRYYSVSYEQIVLDVTDLMSAYFKHLVDNMSDKRKGLSLVSSDSIKRDRLIEQISRVSEMSSNYQKKCGDLAVLSMFEAVCRNLVVTLSSTKE